MCGRPGPGRLAAQFEPMPAVTASGYGRRAPERCRLTSTGPTARAVLAVLITEGTMDNDAIPRAFAELAKFGRRIVATFDALQWCVVATIFLLLILLLCDLMLTVRADRKQHPAEFWKTWRGRQLASLRSLDSIWVMLVLLQCLIVAVFLALLATQAPEHWEAVFDYVGFAAPCFAAIVAGLGILRRVGEEYKRLAKARDEPTTDPDASYYAGSIGFLYLAVAGYVCAHITFRFFALSLSLSVTLCACAHFWMIENRAWNLGRPAGLVPSYLVSWFLFVLTIVAWVATFSGYGALRKIDHCHEIAEKTATGGSVKDKPRECIGIE